MQKCRFNGKAKTGNQSDKDVDVHTTIVYVDYNYTIKHKTSSLMSYIILFNVKTLTKNILRK